MEAKEGVAPHLLASIQTCSFYQLLIYVDEVISSQIISMLNFLRSSHHFPLGQKCAKWTR